VLTEGPSGGIANSVFFRQGVFATAIHIRIPGSRCLWPRIERLNDARSRRIAWEEMR
jgi:hypothetical protein